MTARANVGARLVVLAFVLVGAFGATGEAAGAQPADPPDERVTPPTELLEEYPLRQGRLHSREDPDGPVEAGSAEVPGPRPATGGGHEDRSVVWLLLGAMAALMGLGLIARRVVSARGQWPIPSLQPRLAGPPVVARPAFEAQPARLARAREERGATNSYAVVNQKGGVGKTTISLVLGAAAARRRSRVLLLDLDPQASATSVLGADVADAPTMSDVMLADADCTLADAVRPTGWAFDLAPATSLLRSADSGPAVGGDAPLTKQLRTVADYDLVLIDCPPNLGGLTINALAAASRALVVTEPTYLALQAMEELLDTVKVVAMEQNPALELAGVVLNRVEATAEHKRSVEELGDAFGSRVWEPHVPKRAILQDAMRRGVPPQELQSWSHYALEITMIFDALAVRIEASQVRP